MSSSLRPEQRRLSHINILIKWSLLSKLCNNVDSPHRISFEVKMLIIVHWIRQYCDRKQEWGSKPMIKIWTIYGRYHFYSLYVCYLLFSICFKHTQVFRYWIYKNKLLHAFVTSRLDNDNEFLINEHELSISWLQVIQKRDARVI